MRPVPQENLDDRGRAKNPHRQRPQSYSGLRQYPVFPEELYNSCGIESPRFHKALRNKTSNNNEKYDVLLWI
jgi:hypothetical protein